MQTLTCQQVQKQFPAAWKAMSSAQREGNLEFYLEDKKLFVSHERGEALYQAHLKKWEDVG